jgi:para-nitrobenzyl esterase
MSTGIADLLRQQKVRDVDLATPDAQQNGLEVSERRKRPGRPTPVIATTGGAITGIWVDGVAIFKGIPYGAPTSGVNRFRPPIRPTPWPGIRACTQFGEPAVQGVRSGLAGIHSDKFLKLMNRMFGSDRVRESEHPGEDCLSINLFTCGLTPGSGPALRPVMVWLHGGGFEVGSGSSAMYDGSNLCKRGDVVVVTLNHRLSAFGYLYLGHLDPEFADSGNVGMLDIVLALRWLRENIKAFGGDPNNVTIFGEGGGGGKVETLMAMPPARGLFHKAIVQSASAVTMVARDVAANVADQTLAALAIKPADVRLLQTLNSKLILEAASKAQQHSSDGPWGFLPVVDGRSLPHDPVSPTSPTESRDVPLLIGTEKTEATLYLVADALFGGLSEQEARERSVATISHRGGALYDKYRALMPEATPDCLLAAIMTDSAFRAGAITMAERKAAQVGAHCYMYRLDWATSALDGRLHSPHGLDKPFIFDNIAEASDLVGTGKIPQLMADVMSQAWITFARTGAPGSAEHNWPPYENSRRSTMIFNIDSKIVNDPDSKTRQLWSTV